MSARETGKLCDNLPRPCSRCGYDTQGLPRCPECGDAAVAASASERRRRPVKTLLLIGWITTAAIAFSMYFVRPNASPDQAVWLFGASLLLHGAFAWGVGFDGTSGSGPFRVVAATLLSLISTAVVIVALVLLPIVTGT